MNSMDQSSQQLPLPYEIEDACVREWYTHHIAYLPYNLETTPPKDILSEKPIALYIAYPGGIGDFVQQTPLLREVEKLYSQVILVTDKRIECLTKNCIFVDAYICWNNLFVSSEWPFCLVSDECWNFIKRLSCFYNISVICAGEIKNNTSGLFIIDRKHPVKKIQSDTICRAELFGKAVGINVTDTHLSIGFDKEKLDIETKKNNVGVCIGSTDQRRRLHPDSINSFAKVLSSAGYNIFVIGFECQEINANYCKIIDGVTLNTALNYLSQMDFIITPDTSFLHCGLALGKPVISIQSMHLNEELIPDVYWDNVYNISFDTVCEKTCVSCNSELFFNEPRTRQCFSKKINRLIFKSDVNCHKGRKTSVPCLSVNMDNSIVRAITKMKGPFMNAESIYSLVTGLEWSISKYTHPSVHLTSVPRWFRPLEHWDAVKDLLTFLSAFDLKIGLEIGLGECGMHLALKQLCPRMITIDIAHHSLVFSAMILEKANALEGSSFVLGDSKKLPTFSAIEDLLGGQKLDLLLIDGDHSYDGCKNDNYYSKFVRSGGIILFHDYKSEAGVTKFVNELKKQEDIKVIESGFQWAYYLKK